MGPWHVVLVGQARQSVVCAYAPPMVSTTGPLQGDIKAHCVTCSYLIGCLLASQRVGVRKILITQQRAFTLHESLEISPLYCITSLKLRVWPRATDK